MKSIKQAFKQAFKPIRRSHGGFGHAIAKYSKNPGIRHQRKREAESMDRKVVPILNPMDSVRSALAKGGLV